MATFRSGMFLVMAAKGLGEQFAAVVQERPDGTFYVDDGNPEYLKLVEESKRVGPVSIIDVRSAIPGTSELTADTQALFNTLWRDLHVAAIANVITPVWLSIFYPRIPCGECRLDFVKDVERYPCPLPDPKKPLVQFWWTVRRHNAVNKKAHEPKPRVTFKNARKTWIPHVIKLDAHPCSICSHRLSEWTPGVREVKCNGCGICPGPKTINLITGKCPKDYWSNETPPLVATSSTVSAIPTAPTKRSVVVDATPADFFDGVFVINLKKRPDRLKDFWDKFPADWPWMRPTVVEAIDGNKVGTPPFFRAGGGAFGCWTSHVNVIRYALMNDLKRIFVLEDDCLFVPDYKVRIIDFYSKIPSDWEVAMLGGQHVNSTPVRYAPGVVRPGGGGGIQRTHAYALQGSGIWQLHQLWGGIGTHNQSHCDHVMGPFCAQLKTFAPDPWVAGQMANRSDITGSDKPAYFWCAPRGHEPIVLLTAPATAMRSLIDDRGPLHIGYTREGPNGCDSGLHAAVILSDVNRRSSDLRQFVETITREAASLMNHVPCVWHPDLPAAVRDQLRKLYGSRLIEIKGNIRDEIAAQIDTTVMKLVGLPPDSISAKVETSVVVVSSLKLADALVDSYKGHRGYWRDEVTGMDNGLRKIMEGAVYEPGTDRSYALRGWAETLEKQAKENALKLVVAFHPQLDPKELEGVVEKVIDARAAQTVADLIPLLA